MTENNGDSLEKIKYEKLIEDLAKRSEALVGLEKRDKEVKELGLALAERERKLKIEEDKNKNLFIENQRKIADTFESVKKKIAQEDKERRDKSQVMTGAVDMLAQSIYNAHNQSITTRLRETLIKQIEPILAHFGIEPKFNNLNQYIPIEQLTEGWIGIEVKESGRDKVEVISEEQEPEKIKEAFVFCKGIYESVIDNSTVALYLYNILKPLSELVDEKSEADIKTSLPKIKSLFNEFDGQLRYFAEVYQEAENYEMSNWICDVSEKLCKLLDIGIREESNMAINER